jgi:hypothetical protein
MRTFKYQLSPKYEGGTMNSTVTTGSHASKEPSVRLGLKRLRFNDIKILGGKLYDYAVITELKVRVNFHNSNASEMIKQGDACSSKRPYGAQQLFLKASLHLFKATRESIHLAKLCELYGKEKEKAYAISSGDAALHNLLDTFEKATMLARYLRIQDSKYGTALEFTIKIRRYKETIANEGSCTTTGELASRFEKFRDAIIPTEVNGA